VELLAVRSQSRILDNTIKNLSPGDLMSVDLVPRPVLALAFGFLDWRTLVLVGQVCGLWKSALKNTRIELWARLCVRQFLSLVRLLGPTAQDVRLTVDLQTDLLPELATSLGLCSQIHTLGLYSLDSPTSLLAAPLDMPTLTYLEYAGTGEEFRLGWSAPCLSRLKLHEMVLVPHALDSLQSLRSLELTTCKVSEGSLPLGLDRLTIYGPSQVPENELARAGATLKEFTMAADKGHAVVVCRTSPCLHTLRVSGLFPKTADRLRALAPEFKALSTSLRVLVLWAVDHAHQTVTVRVDY